MSRFATSVVPLLRKGRTSLGRDGAWPVAGTPGLVQVCAWLAVVSYVLIAAFAVGLAGGWAFTRDDPEGVAVLLLVTVHGLQLARLVVAGRAWPERRHSSALLIGVIVLFNVGLTVDGALGSRNDGLPLDGGALFLPAYLTLAVYLAVDAPGRWTWATAPLLDAAVVWGSATCASATLLVDRVVDLYPDIHGPHLLVLFTYPLVAIVMLAGVLFQWIGGRRAWSGQTVLLLGGFGFLALADSSILRDDALSGPIADSRGYPLFLATGLLLVVSSGCGPRILPRPHPAAGRDVVLPPVAALVPIVVLALTDEPVLAVICVATLAAVVARMGLALRQALQLSMTDDLTGLPNRRAVANWEPPPPAAPGRMWGLLIADLDGFTRINSTLGGDAGDQILRRLARRLRAALPPEVVVARLGGDEFGIVAPMATPDAAHHRASVLRDLIARPIDILGHALTMDASVGVALPAPAEPVEMPQLLRRAGVAVYQAKLQHAGALIYQSERDDFTPERLVVAEELRTGIPGQIRVWYQPQVDAATRECVGLEALVRWEHPERGILPPGAFLDIARQSGLMTRLTEAVLDTALNDTRLLLAEGTAARISFNVAPAELLDPVVLRRILTAVDLAGLPPGTLTLEITEDSLIADPERAREALTAVSAHQVEVSIDDYGSGYSSLAYLRDLPVHELKMDRSFVTAVADDRRSRIIVASTSQMARGLGLRTVAEGVEDAAAADQLARLGVDVLQGYWFARPMPIAELRGWLARTGLPAGRSGA